MHPANAQWLLLVDLRPDAAPVQIFTCSEMQPLLPTSGQI